MNQEKAGGFFFHRLFAFKIRSAWWIFLFLFLFIALAGGYISRALWFDEVLMVSNFAWLANPLQIYRSYFIPNNQIIHTIFIHWLAAWTGNEIFLRLFSTLCAVFTILLLWHGFRKKCHDLPLATVLWTWMLSVPFMLYATAVRGYMLAALFVTLALLCGRKYVVSGKISALAGWFAASYSAVGVMPSALAGIAAAGFYILPLLGRKFYCKKKFYLLTAAPFAAFLLFYLPIWEKLMAAFALGEGWHDHPAALLALVLGTAGTFNFLLPAAVWGQKKSRWNLQKLCYLAIWLLPLGGFLLPAAPFPRVWFVLFPVWAVLLAQGICKLKIKSLWMITPALAMVMHIAFAANAISPWCSRGGQDDFFAPYFLRRQFVPHQLVPVLQDLPDGTQIYMPLSADPWAVWWASGKEVRFDSPRGRIKHLPDGTLVIIRRGCRDTEITGRFGGRILKAGEIGMFELFYWRIK